MDNLHTITLLIPSFNPTIQLVDYVTDLIDKGFKNIVVVNDGSQDKYNIYFEELSKKTECTILSHAVNQGKGRTLKTGFNYILSKNKDKLTGIVTADADGQHLVVDTVNVAQELINNPDSLILGTRDFDKRDVPFKSRFGNKTTTHVFKLLYNKKINDTQTGLRGIPSKYAYDCITIKGERFEYEINMLISTVKKNINIKERNIQTVYFENNRETHFNAVLDSLKIYGIMFKMFFKFTLSSLLSAALDIGIFALCTNLLFASSKGNTTIILISTIVARIFSSLFNYWTNKTFVFNNLLTQRSILRYYTICLLQMLISGFGTSFLFNLLNVSQQSVVILKIIVDIILFFISFQIQQHWVFKKKN